MKREFNCPAQYKEFSVIRCFITGYVCPYILPPNDKKDCGYYIRFVKDREKEVLRATDGKRVELGDKL